jgi:hypothetical protein
VRVAALFAVLGLAISTAGCHGGGGGATPPVPLQDQSTTPLDNQTIENVQSAALSTAVTSGVPLHVMTAAIVYGYGGTPTTVPLASVKPFVSWAQTDGAYAAALRAAGIKVDIYSNFWRNYSHDNPNVGYQDLKPGGAHAAAEAKLCNGTVIVDPSYYHGYEADARSSAALGHAQVYVNYRLGEYHGNYDAVFTDDTNAMGGIPLPCNYSISPYISAINRINTALRVPIFFSAFGATASPPSQVPLLAPANVIGGMCEICYAGWKRTSSGPVDYPHLGGRWYGIAQAEIQTVALHKIYWVYARAVGNPTLETGLRKFIYASFLLTYDYRYAMLQVAFKTPHGFPIMPETGLVPMNPLTTASTPAGYKRSTGAYMREFANCYFHGVSVGKCAVAVNPNSYTVNVPSAGYTHSMVLSGSGVLDGGTVSFKGGRVTALPSAGGAILFP